MTRYWTADSDFDWQDSVGMYEEPSPEATELPEPTRNEALDEFFAVVREAIPETVPDWPAIRERVRDAGLRFAHTAIRDSMDRMLKAFNK
jgi:hypothetical protein